jgi:hypothetical protein
MKIRCCRCGAMPFPPVGSGLRTEFEILNLTERKSEDGKTVWWAPAKEGEGEWFCPLHRRETGAGRFTITEVLP